MATSLVYFMRQVGFIGPVETGDAGKSPLEEASEVTEAAAELQSAVRRGASEREVSTAITKLRREIEDVPAALEARGKKPAGLQH